MPILAGAKIAVILTAALLNFFLGFLVLSRNPKNHINITFFLLAFFYGLWALALLFYDHPIVFTSFFWIKITYFNTTIFEILTLAFSFVFPKPSFGRLRIFAIAASFIYLVYALWMLFFTNYWIEKVIIDSHRGLQTIIGPAYFWWVAGTWVILGWAIGNYLVNAVRSTGKEKEQLMILFVGFALWGISINIPDVILPLVWGETRYFSISTVLSLFFTLSVAYAILRHRFLDMKLAIIRSLVYLLLLLTTGAFYMVSLYLIHFSFVKNFDSLVYIIASTSLAMLAVFTFHPALYMIEKLVNKFIHHTYYDSDSLLYALTQVMAAKVELKDVIAGVLEIIRENMHIALVSVDVNSDNQLYSKQVSPAGEIGFGFTKDELEILGNAQKMLITQEMPASEAKKILMRESAEIFIPLKIKENLIGYLILSEKMSGDVYFPQDINVLEILAAEFAVAIQNALSFEKVRNFNKTLGQEVEKATEDLRLANVKLKELDALKDEFISIASHELRTPMTIARNNLWFLINKKPASSKEAGLLLGGSYKATERTIRLVDDILNVSKIEANRIKTQITVFDLSALISEVKEEMVPKAKERNIGIADIQPAALQVKSDQERIRQIIVNLIDNSIKYTPKNGKIKIEAKKNGSKVEVSISDTGIGIKKEDLPKLFTKFGRLETSLSSLPKATGTGLGLYIAKRLVELLGGKINVKSVFGHGSTFTFTLPGQ